MKVFVAGSTGVLGRRIVETCTARGHDVVGLTRDERGDQIVRDRGGVPHRGDVLDRASLIEGAADADAVVHAATKIPTDTDPDDEDWERNNRIRRVGATNLVAAAASADAERVLLQSVVWLARQPDGGHFDEESAPNPDRSTQSALDAERIVDDGATTHGFDPVVLRGGYFYAPDAAHTRLFGERLLGRQLPIVGRGLLGRRDTPFSFVHVDDAGRAFADAIEGEATGTFHVVDDEPTTYGQFLRTLAERLNAPRPRRVPAWLARFAVDDQLVRLLTNPMPTTNERFRAAFDWSPRYPTVEDGLDQVVDQWRETGTIRELEASVR
ncbi:MULTISPECIES: NAD-dependent epimerase/dehydratase family protein [Haloarcula]|uniref:dTDP-glucose 4,6-dehydratase n=1 Tax=Haloarcula pellucida TaxID=1427151 RepID=A0A830GQH4_9EURY|nr:MULTISPECIES: NAD(P)-dependent oxidoreductase [Halomicroarcula]MBX0350279.1 NAD(P)-dependent oxidoreductase [Halomicroarcula pellucida]MDS0277619.1 NAD(P)-dependent oxidoreductase [Halomicroarcula sp. S1AR25-4]GGO01302.1 dTDP-glucose 4,6-dehydratase [Halomicroarcula pellucida]